MNSKITPSNFALDAVMKCLLIILAILGAFSAPSFASDCRVTLSRPLVDYGKLVPEQAEQFNNGSVYPLTESNVLINAFCSEPKRISLAFSGMTKNGLISFGDNGFVAIEAFQATLDGKHVQLGKTTGPGNMLLTGPSREHAVVLNNTSLVPVGGQSIIEGQQFQVTLKLKPVMNLRGLKPSDQSLMKSDLHVQVISE